MSNVLIGIIGVILFIGLALAGALFLGPRFQESTNNSKAAAAVQGVAQVASAIAMYETQEGVSYPMVSPVQADGILITKGYLKSVFRESNGGTPYVTDNYDNADIGGRYVILGNLTEEVCKAVQRQTNRTDVILTNPAGATGGCAVINGNRFVFSRI